MNAVSTVCVQITSLIPIEHTCTVYVQCAEAQQISHLDKNVYSVTRCEGRSTGISKSDLW